MFGLRVAIYQNLYLKIRINKYQNYRKGIRMNDKIIIKGAKEHNLKNIDIEIPRDKLVVITGLSGSREVLFSV